MTALNMLSKARRQVASTVRQGKFARIYERYQDYTMITHDNYLKNLALALQFKHVSGAIVECGVWRGGMIAGIAQVAGPERSYYLFDSFEGLPDAKEIDGPAAQRWQADKDSPHYYDNCTADESFARQAMEKAGVTQAHFIKGYFDQTLATVEIPEPIALLRLDGDWYDSTMVCLKSLYRRVVPGGGIIIDDYYTWDGCTRAVHDFLSQEGIPDRVRQFDNSICYLIRGEE
jgi:O-methyltransferase